MFLFIIIRWKYLMHRCGCESQCIKPYSLKTCEDEIVLELDKKQPIRTMYQINTLFWLDTFKVSTKIILESLMTVRWVWRYQRGNQNM
jgi:hypothetical protein